MLLTLKPPAYDLFRNSYDVSPPLPPKPTRFPSPVTGGIPFLLPPSGSQIMSTPHRGLPPPAAMTLPAPDRGPPPVNPPMGQLPAPPSQWQGAEDSMRNWLHAKAEEDRRKQEEEKTRQETLRLEQRKIEQSMLRESLQGGVPPYMVPMVFAGMGGGNLANTSLEWAQHYMAQLQLQQQQQQQQSQALPPPQTSPELRRESRLIGQPQAAIYGPSQQSIIQPPLSVVPLQQQTQQSQQTPLSGYQLANISPSSSTRAGQSQTQPTGPTSAPRPPIQTTLPRLNTGEMQIQQPPQTPQGIQISASGQPVHVLQQTQAAQQQEAQQTSPSIYFHHWVPPSSQAGSGSNQPSTPSG
ncbi:MAG: hypothetical protein M1819_000474 [Sarea resinae]|nr:MAG: hypothetical protein M1819_000474 [Sarea resinae]